MTFWSDIISEGWLLAIDLMGALWPVAVVPFAFAVTAFVIAMAIGIASALRGSA